MILVEHDIACQKSRHEESYDKGACELRGHDPRLHAS